MKHTKFMNDMQNSSFEAIEGTVADLKEELRLARLDLMTGKSKNSSVISELKKKVARAKTIQREVDA